MQDGRLVTKVAKKAAKKTAKKVEAKTDPTTAQTTAQSTVQHMAQTEATRAQYGSIFNNGYHGSTHKLVYNNMPSPLCPNAHQCDAGQESHLHKDKHRDP